MKKLVLMTITFSLILMAVSACGSKSDGSAKPSSSSGASASGGAQETGKKEQVTITFASHVANVQETEAATWNIFQKFMEKNPDIKIDIQGTETNEHIKKMKMMAQSNNLPDMFWMLPAPAKEMYKAGLLLDLKEFLGNHPEVASAFESNMISPYEVDGKQFGLPYQALITGMWYNKSLFDQYKLKVPETYEELRDAVKVFKQNGVTAIGKSAKDPFSVWAFLTMLVRYGFFEKIDNIMAGTEKYHNADFLKLYQKIDELRVLGAFPENVSTMDMYQAAQMFYGGKSAMLDSGVWEIRTVGESSFAKDAGFSWGPSFSDGVGNQKIKMVVAAAPIVVSAKVKEDQAKYDAVQKFLAFYYSEEGAKIMLENNILPVIKYNGKLDREKQPVLALILDQMQLPGWESPVAQPDLVVPEAVGNAMYDSIYGVINGIYTPEEALDVVDKKIAETIKK